MNPRSSMQKRILLVDDHPVFRKGLKSLLEDEEGLRVIGEAGDGQEALALIKELSPDIVVMDITMPGLNGIAATKRIVAEFPNTSVVALSIHSEKQFVQDMLQAGAAGYILKESVPEDLVKGIKAVMLGNGYLSPSITGLVVSQFREFSFPQKPHKETVFEILEAKLHAPDTDEYHIYRPRLVRHLENNRKLPIQTIIAPAGYGKSTLVSCWFSAHEWPKSWLSLDEHDNDFRYFFSYFIHALNSLFPKSLSKSKALLEAGQLPGVQVISTILKNEINRIEQNFIIVLDDFHFIKEKKVHDLLAELLCHPSKQMHLILIARTDPFLPKDKLHAQGQIAEIRLQDLRFTDTETAEFLQSILSQYISKSIARRWEEVTEGWITGLRLAALSIRNHDDLNRVLKEVKGSEQLVNEYLFHEVLASVPQDIFKHLLPMSILDRFSAGLCEALCPYPKNKCELGGWGVIRWLKKNNLFLMPLDNEGYWFRYHHLFKELLEKQVERRHSPEEISELHTKASAWFAENDFTEEAIGHALAAGDMEGAVDLVGKNRQTILNNDKWYVLKKWLSIFPDEVIQQRLELLMAQIWIHYHDFNIPVMPSIIETIKQYLNDTPEEQPLLGELDFFHGYLFFFKNDAERSLQHLQKALDRVPEEHQELRGQIEIFYDLASQMQGNKQKAVSRLNDLLYKYHGVKDVRMSRLLISLVYIHLISGNLPDALMANQQLSDLSHKGKYLYAETWSKYLQGLIHFYQNDLDCAINYFQQTVKNKEIVHLRAAVDSLAGLVLSYQAKGQSDRAGEVMQELADYVTPLNDPAFSMIVRSCQTRLSIMKGEWNSNVNWFQQVPAGAENIIWWLEDSRVTHCRALLAEGSPPSLLEANTRLEKLLQSNCDNHNVCQVVQVMPLLAMVYKKQERDDEALETLMAAVSLAGQGGLIWPFIELGPAMEDLLKLLLKHHAAKDYIYTLLTAFRQQGQGVASPIHGPQTFQVLSPEEQALVESFTTREMEILQLLEQRFQNKEIAAKLFISSETVKTHLKKIFEKLDVSNRREAVSKAYSFGVLFQKE